MRERLITETVTDEMLGAATEVCRRYKKVMEDSHSFEIYRSVLVEKLEGALTDRERKLYRGMIDDAVLNNTRRLIWIHRAEWALNRITYVKPREVVRQHYFEGLPLKAIEDEQGHTMGKSVANYHRKNGVCLLAIELKRFDEIYPDKAAEARKVKF